VNSGPKVSSIACAKLAANVMRNNTLKNKLFPMKMAGAVIAHSQYIYPSAEIIAGQNAGSPLAKLFMYN
jgi:hypothetical protein